MTDSLAINQTLSMTAKLEALLFVAPGLVSVAQLAAALDVSTSEVEEGLEALAAKYGAQDSGLRLQNYRGRYQLTTAPEAAELIEHFLGLEATSRLSRAALEALSIVAYRQPATRPQVDAIRGVNSDYVLKSLLSKGVIEEIGRAETPGRPILYGTTPEFLQYFGLNSLDDLPPLNLDEESQDAEQNGQVEVLKE
ncbi:MAG: SMC-Scp complex subunit ScpB [Anaerolineales bacterium]|jgi:segregation and condensation protein B